MSTETRPQFRFSKTSLRARVALGVALPILLILIALSLMNYWRERQLLEDQIRLTALLSGEMVMDTLHHAMLTNNQEMLAETLVKMGELENIQQVQIVGLDGRVRAHSNPPINVINIRQSPAPAR